MSIGWPQILLVAVLVLLLFGRGKIASLMGEVAQGIKSFRKGMEDEPDSRANLTAPPPKPAQKPLKKDRAPPPDKG